MSRSQQTGLKRPLGSGTACCALLALVTFGCTLPHPSAPLRPAADPRAAFAAVREREQRITTLRARFSADTRFAGTHRSADGVLLVKKPDRFRLRMMLPFGLTVFDYLAVGDLIWVELPLEDGKAMERRPEDLAPFSREDFGAVFLRGDYAFPGTCEQTSVTPEEVVVSCPPLERATREIHINLHTSTVTEETAYDVGEVNTAIRYDDYRAVSDTVLPFHITMSYPQRDLVVDIAIQHYEVNPTMADELFQPVSH